MLRLVILMEINLGTIQLRKKLNIGDIRLGVKKLSPELENIEITPSKEKQTFKSKKYGFETVYVNKISTTDLEVTPSAEEQNFEGVFGNVKVKGVEADELNLTPTVEGQVKEGLFKKVTVEGDSNLIPANIKKGEKIFGVEGTMDGAWDSSQIRNCTSLFSENTDMIVAPYFNTCNVISMEMMNFRCTNLERGTNYNTSNVENFNRRYYQCDKLVTLDEIYAGKATSIWYMIYPCGSLTNFGGLKDIGKAFAGLSANYMFAEFDLSGATKLTHESLMNVINKLYDLNITYDVANGGTLKTQKLKLGSRNIAKLTPEEIAIATNKGWTVS